MMSVREYASDVNFNVEKILKLFVRLKALLEFKI